MWFDGREIPPFAEPIDVDQIEEGECYFIVTFADNDLTIPIVETVVFIGVNPGQEDHDQDYYFQDYESHKSGVRFGKNGSNKEAVFYSCRRDNAKNIFDFEKTLECLMRCQLMREKRNRQ